MDANPVRSLAEYGQSVWIEGAPRAMIRSGRLARLTRTHGLTGMVSAATVSEADDDEIRELLAAGEETPEAIVLAICARHARAACDALLEAWRSTDGRDGYVSFSPHDDVERAARWREQVGRPNLLVRIAATTAEGVAAVEDAVATGVSVNAMPVFSPGRYREVTDAYMRGLERLIATGGDPRTVKAVAGIPIALVDAEVDRRLGGSAPALRGRLALANARLAYKRYMETLGTTRWRALAAAGARPPRCAWLSTSPINPAYSDVLYVEQLIGADTITTMSVQTLAAFEHHGVVADRLGRGVEDAQRVLDDVCTAGVDLDDVWRTLEAHWSRTHLHDFDRGLRRVAARCAQLAGG